MAITFTQTDLDNLKEALVTGAEEVQIGDRKIKYRSKKDLIETIKMVEQSIGGSVTGDSSSLIQARFRKGRCE